MGGGASSRRGSDICRNVSTDRHMLLSMHIALVTDGMHPFVIGGMQRHSRMLAEHLARHGSSLTVLHTVLDPSRAEAAKQLVGFPDDLRDRVSAVFVPYPRVWRYPGHYLPEQAEYSRRCLQHLIDSGCHADFIYAQGLTGRAFQIAKRRGLPLPPVGVNTHGYEMYQRAADWRTELKSLLVRRAFRRVNLEADYVFSFSGKIREIAMKRVGVPAQRIIEVPNAIDGAWIREAVPPSTSRRAFVFIGRNDRRKGVPELLAACKVLPSTGWSLEVIGPIQALPGTDLSRVRFLGPVTDSAQLQERLDRSDCLVCPSFAEGMPTVILEAMARGLAIIATDVGATREIVDRANGVLIPFPTIAGIAGAMQSFINAPSVEIDQMKLASLQRSRSYTWERVSKLLLDRITLAVRGDRKG